MEDNSCGAEGNFDALGRVGGPVEDLLNILLLNGELVAITDGSFKEHSDGVGKSLYKASG